MERSLKDVRGQEVQPALKKLLPKISIIAIVLLAFGLRLWSIDFGLPYPYHIDEIDYTKAALELACHGNFHSTLIQPQTYIHAGTLWVANIIDPNTCTNVSKTFASPQALLLSRFISIMFGTLTVFLIYLLGDRSFGSPVGIIAALFTAINFLHVRESHFGTPDIAAEFFLVAALLSYISLSKNRTLRNYIIAVALTVMAISGRITFGLLVLPLAYVHLMPFFSTPNKSIKVLLGFVFNRTVIVCIAVGAIAFLLLTPIILVDPRAYLSYWHNFFALSKLGGFGRFKVDDLSAPVFYARAFLWSDGILLSLLVVLGVIWSIWKHKLADVLLLAFTLAYLLIASRAGTYFSRYNIPAAVLLGILAARFIWEIWPKGRMVYGLGVVLILISLQPFIYSSQFDNLLHQEDTRTIALDWINTNIPEGAKMAVEYHTPFVDRSRYKVTAVDIHGSWQTELSEYCRQNFEYLVNSNFIDDLKMIKSDEDATKRAFYEKLDQSAKLVFEVKPYSSPTAPPFYFDQLYGPITSMDQLDRPGPTIKIYQLEKGTAACQ